MKFCGKAKRSTLKGIYAEPEYTGTALPDDSLITAAPAGWPQKPVYAPAGGPPGAPIQWGDSISNNTVSPGFGYVGTGDVEEILRYFYHSDHLGSTSYITDAQGNVTQYIAYMPFGESFVEQHSAWDSPYKFNGKEMDTETGLYYYGARYYDPKTSVWLGVDPKAEKYIGWSPFVYVRNNPANMVDPNGMDDYFSNDGKYLRSDDKKSRTIIIVDGKKETQLKDYTFNKKNAGTLTSIAKYYAKEAGVDVSKLKNKDFSVANIVRDMTQTGQLYNKTTEDLHNGGVASSSDAVMNADKDEKKISIVLTDGQINDELNDGNNFMSDIKHERDHFDNATDGFGHLQVYYNQVTDPLFAKTTSEFQSSTLSNASTLLSECRHFNDPQLTKAQNNAIHAAGVKWEQKFKPYFTK